MWRSVFRGRARTWSFHTVCSGRRSVGRAGQFGTGSCSRGFLRRERRAPLWLRLCHPVLQLFRILARREDFTVARPASSARTQFVPSDSLAPNSPAQFGRTHEPLHPVRHAGRLPCERGPFPSAPSLSAFLPISAVFHSAPPRSERFQKTPQRSEGTQRRKGRKRAPRTLYGGWQSFASTLAAPRAPLSLRPRRSVFIVARWSFRQFSTG